MQSERRDLASSIRAAGRVAWAIIGLLLVAAAFVAGFAYTRSVTIPILLAWVLAIVFQPFVDWLEKRGLPRGVSAAAVLLGMVVVLIGVVALIAATLVSNWDEISTGLSDAASKIDDTLSNTSLSATLGSEANSSIQSVGSTLGKGAGAGIASAFNSLAGGIAGLVLGLWVAYYVLKGRYVEDSPSKDSATDERRSYWTEIAEFSHTSIRGYFASLTCSGWSTARESGSRWW